MFIFTLNGPRALRRALAIGLLALLTFGFTALGGVRLIIAAAEGEDRPLTRAPVQENRVALTFDVTWGKDELTRILTVLEQQGVKATFFVGGTFLSNYPDMAKELVAKGHDVGTLGQKVMDLSQLPEQEVTSNLLASQSTLSKTLGGPVRYFRPPQGEATPAVVRAAKAAQLTTVTHSIDSEDYLDTRRSAEIVRRVLKAATKGDIIHLTASDFSKETAKALPALIEGLKAKGFAIVPLSQMMGAVERN